MISRPNALPAVLLCFGLLFAACQETEDPAPSNSEREAVQNALDLYVEGLVAQDASILPLASDVLFVSPTGSERKGIDEVAPFLEAQEFNEIRVHQTLIDGEYGCELTDYYWTEGETVPVALCLRVVDGEITEIRPYFDTALLDGN